jgi:hypothetical protein
VALGLLVVLASHGVLVHAAAAAKSNELASLSLSFKWMMKKSCILDGRMVFLDDNKMN